MLRVQIAIAAPSLEGANPLRSVTFLDTFFIQRHMRWACVAIITEGEKIAASKWSHNSHIDTSR